jgi:hypothetical protein
MQYWTLTPSFSAAVAICVSHISVSVADSRVALRPSASL